MACSRTSHVARRSLRMLVFHSRQHVFQQRGNPSSSAQLPSQPAASNGSLDSQAPCRHAALAVAVAPGSSAFSSALSSRRAVHTLLVHKKHEQSVGHQVCTLCLCLLCGKRLLFQHHHPPLSLPLLETTHPSFFTTSDPSPTRSLAALLSATSSCPRPSPFFAVRPAHWLKAAPRRSAANGKFESIDSKVAECGN